MKTNYTPGPWKALRSNESEDGNYFDPEPGELFPYATISAPDGRAVVTCHDLAKIKEGDAHLIAAAPDLLEALEGFLSWSIENEERPNYATKVQKPVVVEKVRAAIAKARGEVVR
jgi:hypothetical protein